MQNWELERKGRRLFANQGKPIRRSDAAYDPLRDGKPVWRTPFAELMGEPPIGRSALEKRWNG